MRNSYKAAGKAMAALLLGICLPASTVARSSDSPSQETSDDASELRREVAQLRSMLEKLEKRIDQLENAPVPVAEHLAPEPSPSMESARNDRTPEQAASTQTTAAQPGTPSTGGLSGVLAGTTVNLLLDTYYEYNFNAPIGRANLLRAYDVSSNSFSLNQAALVLENAPDVDAGKRWGARLDLQWGQATQTLQGNSANEPRPEIYRALFQAYGTYVAPIGRGLTVDFGKWSSSLGYEGNYTKDQMNYSRSYWFSYLPFYHMGVRANYSFSDRFTVHYWVTNGTEQTEAFNGFKDQSAGFVWQPRKNVNWTVNYYLGQEHPDVTFYPSGAPSNLTNLPTQQGVPFDPISSPPRGKLHIFDSYVTWQASPALSFALEGDWVIERQFATSPPAHVDGGAAYARYQLTPKFALAARSEYLSDRGGLFSGVTQALKEATFTSEYKLIDGFLVRLEWRRDFSNRPYFYSDTLGILRNGQTTTGVGVVWWFGAKTGAW